MINGAIESAVSKVESAILNQIAKSISFGSVFFFFKKNYSLKMYKKLRFQIEANGFVKKRTILKDKCPLIIGELVSPIHIG
jgi:hypothetical protein